MPRHFPSLLLSAALLALTAAPASAQDPLGTEHEEAKQNARTAAEQWLDLADTGEFGRSWDEAATMMQEQMSREAWKEKGAQAKDEFTTLESRQLTRALYRDSLQQTPDEGPFVILEYRSVFATGSCDEIILAVKEEDTWKVAGYQVAPARSLDAERDTNS